MRMKESKESYGPGDVVHRMILTNQMHKRMLNKKLDGVGLHGAQHRLLMTLACGRFSSQVELAKKLEVSPATVAVTLKSMEKAGLISKKTRRDDNRVNFVELTEEGKRIVEESGEFFDTLDREMCRGFSAEEREQLCHYLDRIYENMQQMAKKKEGGQNETV